MAGIGSGALANIVSGLAMNLGSLVLEEMGETWGFEEDLEKLKDTVNTIKDVLSYAEQRQVESQAVQGWLKRLGSVVYDADDLFDEFSTMVMRKELTTGSTLSDQVRLFLTDLPTHVKKLRGKLDAIAEDGNKYAFKLQGSDNIGQALLSLGKREDRETHSFVPEDEVIGREEDREKIVEMLMLDVEEKISVLSIVGMGGLGKTVLAELVFNDDKIKNHFESSCKANCAGVIGGKKYLLVLDDLWNENREKWLKLENLLRTGSMGSKILITTRSKKVAKIAGKTTPYDLKGLSDEKSWSLFESMAFESRDSTDQLVEVGKEIVKKYANVPLAIKTLGCHLYGKEESVWLLFKENELPKIPEGGDSIMAILKISYYHLPSLLKNCFAYCALFPKNYEMDNKSLIYLWMTKGFIIPSPEGQSLEDAEIDMGVTERLRRIFAGH
ncbi:hypothetical protein Dimus_017118 [Dionaea muscipula]